MKKKVFTLTKNQIEYLIQNFTRYPTHDYDFELHEQTKEVCPNCSEKMEHMCIGDSFTFVGLVPQEKKWKSSGIFSFSICKKCDIAFLNDDEFLEYTGRKFSFGEYLEAISKWMT